MRLTSAQCVALADFADGLTVRIQPATLEGSITASRGDGTDDYLVVRIDTDGTVTQLS
jgi:hypothetical protein